MGEQAEHLNAAVQGLILQRSQHLSGIYERHQKMDERVKQFARVLLDEKKRSAQIGAVHDLRMRTHKKMDRTIQFWTRTIGVYASYKATQARVQFVKDRAERDRIWEERHEIAADKIYALCTELGGFFLKSAQILAKPDLTPLAWVKRLVVLCDQAPQTPFATVVKVLEQELGRPVDDVFERFEVEPLGSASIAQVHRARIRGASNDVAVKVQHPGAHELMMTDIRNHKYFASFLQRFDVQFDLISILEELEEQIEYEFDFVREANSMDRISESLNKAFKGKSPIIIPHSVPHLVTEKVLVMDFIEGTPILKLGAEMEKRGINPNSSIAKYAKRNILSDLAKSYGSMILEDGFFQADPHPGNILINKGGKVALLDYGQVKEIDNGIRLGFARLVVAIASGNIREMGLSFRDLGIETSVTAEADPKNFKILATGMFDSKLPPGMTMLNPFCDDSVLSDVSVKTFPKGLFYILRTIQILRGLSIGMDSPFSSSEMWKPLALQVLASAGKSSNQSDPVEARKAWKPRELAWERRPRSRRRQGARKLSYR
jgi:aarF domain-containing kinase